MSSHRIKMKAKSLAMMDSSKAPVMPLRDIDSRTSTTITVQVPEEWWVHYGQDEYSLSGGSDDYSTQDQSVGVGVGSG